MTPPTAHVAGQRVRPVVAILPALLCLVLAGLSPAAASVHQDMGLPFMTVFYPDDYNGMGQNWDVVQNERGLIYLANGDGVFEYDGVEWRWLEEDINRTARSLDVGPANTLYVGYHNELGYFTPDSSGRMSYTSLTPQLPDSTLQFRDVWATVYHENRVYFSSLSHIFSWQVDASGPVDGSLRVWASRGEDRFQGLQKVGSLLMVIHTGVGVQVLEKGAWSTLSGTNTRDLRSIWSLLPKGTDLILLGYQGAYLYDGRTMRFWDTEVSRLARDTEAYSATVLGAGYYALGSDNEGLILFDEGGRVLRVVNREQGLPNNQVFNYPYMDQEGGVWVCLDYGLARVELLSGLQRYDYKLGLRGGVLDVVHFNGQLAVGTSQGLFYPRPAEQPGMPVRFEQVDGVSSTWSMVVLDEQLLIADENSLISIPSLTSPPTVVLDDISPFSLAVDSNSNRVFVGCSAGKIHSLRRERGRWVEEGVLVDLQEDVSWLTLAPDRSLWATYGFDTLRYARIEIDQGAELPDVLNLQRFTEEDGFKQAVPGRPFVLDGELLASAWGGLYRWDSKQGTLVLAEDHPLYPITVDDAINLPTVSPSGALWFEDDSGIARKLRLNKDGSYTTDSPLRRTPSTGYNMFKAEDGTLWAGMVGLHLLRFDEDAPQPPRHQHPDVLLRTVTASGEPLINHASPLPTHKLELGYDHNELRFDYALPCYDDISRNQYQVRLVGLEDNWSSWSTDTHQQYNSLPPRAYRFEVRGRNVHGEVTPPTVLSFTISPPWYAAWWAVLLWVLLAVGSGYGIVRWRISHVEARNARLDQLVRQRTEELDRMRVAEREAEIKASQMETAYKMAATIAHEFNNPLAIIQASSQLMQKDEFDERKLREFAGKIPPQVGRLRDLLQRILTVEELKEIDYAAGMTILDIHSTTGSARTDAAQSPAASPAPAGPTAPTATKETPAGTSASVAKRPGLPRNGNGKGHV